MTHIRLATIGSVKALNCHPYSGVDCTGRTWTLMHNGTICSGNRLMPYYRVQKGNTDSERIFLYLLDEINQATTKSGAARRLIIKTAIYGCRTTDCTACTTEQVESDALRWRTFVCP